MTVNTVNTDALALEPCTKCADSREIVGPLGRVLPCPRCCCMFCGQLSNDPECRDCFLDEDDRQQRRADV